MRVIGSGALPCAAPVEARLSYTQAGGPSTEPRSAGGRIGFVLGTATGFIVGGIVGALIESLFAKEGADTVGVTGMAVGGMAGAISGGMLGRDIGERLAAPDSAENARDAAARPLLRTPARLAVPVAARFACAP
jgi:cytochrome c biogenesis protein CcdA